MMSFFLLLQNALAISTPRFFGFIDTFLAHCSQTNTQHRDFYFFSICIYGIYIKSIILAPVKMSNLRSITCTCPPCTASSLKLCLGLIFALLGYSCFCRSCSAGAKKLGGERYTKRHLFVITL
jgi:hypothetical protein